MTRRERVLITGGAGAVGSNLCDLLVERGAREIVVLDNFVRGRRDNLAWAEAHGNVTVVEGDICDRALVRELVEGIDVVFHQAALRITQCAEEPRLALEVLVDGTFNVVEAADRGGRAQGRRRVVGVGLRPRRGVPDRREPPPVRQRHALRRRQDVQRGAAALVPRDARARLRRAALLQRLRPADGHPRRLHRGARALDGAHRRGRAAADLRRRARRRWTSSSRRDIARANVLAAESDATDDVFNVASGDRDEPARARRDAAARHGLRPRRRARPRARREQGAAPARRHVRRARGARVRGRGRPRGRAHARSSTGGRRTAPTGASSRPRRRWRGPRDAGPVRATALLRRRGRGARRR